MPTAPLHSTQLCPNDGYEPLHSTQLCQSLTGQTLTLYTTLSASARFSPYTLHNSVESSQDTPLHSTQLCRTRRLRDPYTLHNSVMDLPELPLHSTQLCRRCCYSSLTLYTTLSRNLPMTLTLYTTLSENNRLRPYTLHNSVAPTNRDPLHSTQLCLIL